MTEQKITKQEIVAAIVRKRREKEELPHLHAFPWYTWAWEFFTSVNKVNLLCAANQVSKSSTMIRKCIEWATNPDLWPSLWSTIPNQFWYMYPSRPVLEAEYETKWKQFLPKGSMKDDPKRGWEEMRKKGELVGLRFNTGIILYFKLYSQKSSDLQAGSVYALWTDEEVPMHHFQELMFRLAATNGYFHAVFTATLGQDFWRRALEPKKSEQEELVGAWKRQVSLYDSMKYVDGTPSQWTEERIGEVIRQCKSQAEVQKRVFGKFVMTSGRKYHAFDATRHSKKAHPIPPDWHVYCAADHGSGGDEGHPAALCYVAVRPDYKQGRVFAGWRGDGILTDASYVVRKHKEIKEQKKLKPVTQFYDWGSKEFYIVAQGMGETFIPADKSHDLGEKIINSLFANDMMFIYESEELGKLSQELSSLLSDTPKRAARDDFADAFRYAVTKIPWDFSDAIVEGGLQLPMEKDVAPKLSAYQQEVADRRKQMIEGDKEPEWPDPELEFDEINSLCGEF